MFISQSQPASMHRVEPGFRGAISDGEMTTTSIIVVATLAPVVAAAIQWEAWDIIRPFVWFLFYPTVFLCAWLGGRWAALLATVVSVLLVLYLFVPPQLSWHVEQPAVWITVVMFAVMGILFGEGEERRMRASARIAQVTADAADAQVQLERRRAELARVDAAVRFQQVVEGIPQLVWTCVPEGACDFLNKRWLDYTEVPLERQLGSGWLEQVHPDDREGLMRTWQAAVSTGASFQTDYRIRGHGGQYRWFDGRALPLRDSAGRVVKWFGTSTDIHEARQAQQELRRRALLLDLAYDPIIVWSESEGIEYWNSGAEHLYGYSRGQAIGQVTHELLQTAFPAPLEEILVALRRDRSWTGELVHTSQDGSRRVMLSRWNLVTVAEREIVLEASRDITERRVHEDAVQRLNAELECKVSERTAELSAANNELESFSYAVAHDLRGPLRAMSGFSTALIEDLGEQLEGEARVDLEQIVLGSRRMGELIDGLLALSRSTQGTLNLITIDLSALGTSILERLQAAEPDRTVDWFVQPAMVARGDRAMLETALSNLLENAWKYTGSAEVARIAFRRDGDGAFCVEDNGAGFDMSYAAKLFQPFQRLHRQDEFPGIGIGLATVQRIIRRHGGEIQAWSAPGAGARFRFTLPLAANGVQA